MIYFVLISFILLFLVLLWYLLRSKQVVLTGGSFGYTKEIFESFFKYYCELVLGKKRENIKNFEVEEYYKNFINRNTAYLKHKHPYYLSEKLVLEAKPLTTKEALDYARKVYACNRRNLSNFVIADFERAMKALSSPALKNGNIVLIKNMDFRANVGVKTHHAKMDLTLIPKLSFNVISDTKTYGKSFWAMCRQSSGKDVFSIITHGIDAQYLQNNDMGFTGHGFYVSPIPIVPLTYFWDAFFFPEPKEVWRRKYLVEFQFTIPKVKYYINLPIKIPEEDVIKLTHNFNQNFLQCPSPEIVKLYVSLYACFKCAQCFCPDKDGNFTMLSDKEFNETVNKTIEAMPKLSKNCEKYFNEWLRAWVHGAHISDWRMFYLSTYSYNSARITTNYGWNEWLYKQKYDLIVGYSFIYGGERYYDKFQFMSPKIKTPEEIETAALSDILKLIKEQKKLNIYEYCIIDDSCMAPIRSFAVKTTLRNHTVKNNEF